MIGPHSKDEPARPDDPFGGKSPFPITTAIYKLATRAVSKSDDHPDANAPMQKEARRCPPNYHWDGATGGCVAD